MEKIRIVKKRKLPIRKGNEDTFSVQALTDVGPHKPDDTLDGSQIGGVWGMTSINHQEAPLADGNENVVSLKLTPEQCSYLLSSQIMNHLPEEMTEKFFINNQMTNDVSVCFNFHFSKPESMRLLRTDQVCEMLQVSKSFLMNLSRNKKIRSYKMGGLRRFSLDDVLLFLTESEDIPRKHSKKGD
jgi:excisionase family DNA binding protein